MRYLKRAELSQSSARRSTVVGLEMEEQQEEKLARQAEWNELEMSHTVRYTNIRLHEHV
jgi:hypothetical protein